MFILFYRVDEINQKRKDGALNEVKILWLEFLNYINYKAN